MSTAFLVTAATLCVLVGFVHSWLGERRLIGPLMTERQGILRHRFARDVLRFAWHVTTIAWFGIGAALVALAGQPASAVRNAILALAATMFVTGMVVLVSGRGRHWAWPVFLAIAGLALAAA